jgi:hypothetical protein
MTSGGVVLLTTFLEAIEMGTIVGMSSGMICFSRIVAGAAARRRDDGRQPVGARGQLLTCAVSKPSTEEYE